jgi:hypothetical protein
MSPFRLPWSAAWCSLAAACLLAIAPAIAPATAAEDAAGKPFPGITCRTEIRQSPPHRLFVAEIDLANPRLRLRVAPGGPDPDGPGKWQTTLLQPTRIAAREGMGLVVNGDFFLTRPANDNAGPGYRAGVWGAVVGSAASNGKVWSTSPAPRPCLVVNHDGSVRIATVAEPSPAAREVIAGNTMLVDHGAAVPHHDQTRHPRTVVGLRGAGGTTLVILVVDGRKPDVAIGMTYAELATEMLRLGCRHALNLDGGGSSVMAVREGSTGAFRILNSPSDGRERPVANVLGVAVTPPAPGPAGTN